MHKILSKSMLTSLGSLHMSLVNRDGLVPEISPRHSFLRKNLDVFIWEAGLARLPRFRFCDRDLGKRDENFRMF